MQIIIPITIYWKYLSPHTRPTPHSKPILPAFPWRVFIFRLKPWPLYGSSSSIDRLRSHALEQPPMNEAMQWVIDEELQDIISVQK